MSDSTSKLTVGWWMAEIATHGMTGAFVGGVWGAFNPYPIFIGSSSSNTHQQAVAHGAKKFPLPPFSSFKSIGLFAGGFASMACIHRSVSCGFAMARNRHDYLNDVVGIFSVAGYINWLVQSDNRILWNNRAVASIAVGSVLYANTGYYAVDSVI